MAANPKRGETTIRIGKHERTLRFRSAQIAMLEERLGMGIHQILSEGSVGIRVLGEALLVGLSHEKKVTPAKVYTWLDQLEDEGVDLGELMAKVFEAVVKGMPGLKHDEDVEDEEGPTEGE